MRIAVAGAGIGGLACAIALADAGHDVCVYEAAPRVLPLGVGINLLPHAARILKGFGVVEGLLASGVATRELVYHNRHGQKIWAEPRGLYAGFEAPQISLARGALQFGLLEAATQRIGEARIVRDRRLTACTQDASRIDFQLTDSSGGAHTESADLLICADGIHSAARASLYPGEGRPIYSGRTLWRATTYAKPFLSGASMIMAGHQDQKFVCYPIEPARADGLQRINWIAELAIPEFRRREDWNREGQREDFLPRFTAWRFDWLDVPALITGADSAIYEYPMVDRDPLPRWSHGRMTLLGDAAHPMYPIGSNGASQAILDVDALARALRANADPVEALAAYEAERLPATAAIVRANRQNGPEHCMQLSEERAPNGFDRIEDVFAPGELQAMADRYKVLTGMKKAGTGAKA
jgi:2-polyprenyl-6-methoxyphenol hydroxylase-like FAD-dependent oxidoreductase